MIETLFGLARLGHTNTKGMPHPLQLAVFAREFSDVIVFRTPPPAVQRRCSLHSHRSRTGAAIAQPTRRSHGPCSHGGRDDSGRPHRFVLTGSDRPPRARLQPARGPLLLRCPSATGHRHRTQSGSVERRRRTRYPEMCRGSAFSVRAVAQGSAHQIARRGWAHSKGPSPVRSVHRARRGQPDRRSRHRRVRRVPQRTARTRPGR